MHRSRQWATLLFIAMAGCRSFTDRAAEYAKASAAAVDASQPMSVLAGQLCRLGARYEYIDELRARERQRADAAQAQKPQPAPLALWPDWYQSSRAARCADWATTGLVVHGALKSLRAYGVAVDSVAEGKALDASGIDGISAGVNTALTALKESGPVIGAATTVGGVLSGLFTAVGQIVNNRALASDVKQAQKPVHDLVEALVAYDTALRVELERFEHVRDGAIKDAAQQQAAGKGELAAQVEQLNALELSVDAAEVFSATKERLDRLDGVLRALEAAHDALASGDAAVDAKLKAFTDATTALEADLVLSLALVPMAAKPRAPAASPPKP